MKGYIRKRTKGSWEITVDIGKHPLTKKRLRHFENVRGNKSQAQKRLTALLYSMDNGRYTQPSQIEVGEFLHLWLQNYAVIQTSPKTYERYEEIVRLHLLPAFGSINISALQPQQIQRYYSTALKTGRIDKKGGLASSTVNKHHRILFEALKWGVKNGLLIRNPAESVDPPPLKTKEPQVPISNEVEDILEKAFETPYATLLYTKAYTGLRRGEVLGLRWCDIDFDAATISVQHSLQQLRSGEYLLKETKTKLSRRQIDLSPDLVSILWDYKTQQGCHREMIGVKLSPTDYVFSHPDGRPLRPNSITRAYNSIARSILPGTTLHGLRHAHASTLLKQNIHPKIVQERLGHSNISTTLDIYSHVVPGLQKAAAKKFDEALPRTSVQNRLNVLTQRLEEKVGKMSAILPLAPILV